MHVIINPTWKCQLHCDYCWLPHSGITHSGPRHTANEWADALIRVLPQGAVVDISGGEPLLFPNLVTLCGRLGRAGIRWAITSNLLHRPALDEFLLQRPPGGVCWNASVHAGNPDVHQAAAALRSAGWFVNLNGVDHPAAPEEGRDRALPYQDWENGDARDGKVRWCDAGLRHWAADPDGDLWRCSVHCQMGLPPLGNLFSGETRPVGPVCTTGCTTCYRDTPEAWCLNMHEIEGGSDATDC